MAKNYKGVKYALLTYSTENVGDDIQSIAARRFLPRVDYYIDRDQIGEWENNDKNETVKLIANGWYMRDPFKWPPSDKTLDPLLISMYIEPNPVGKNKVVPRNVFLASQSREYLGKYGPVGARDMSTLRFLQNNGIETYFSGCLTLTLQKDPYIKKQDFILAIDVSDKVYKFMQSKTNRKIIRISPYGDFDMPKNSRLIAAEYFLMLYQSAHAVVTTRLHATLPCLALETPVLLIKERGKYNRWRYSGLAELAYNLTPRQYYDHYDEFNLDTPPNNHDNYKIIRRQLIKKCSEFTGYDNQETFLWSDISNMLLNDNYIDLFADSFNKRLPLMLVKQHNEWLEAERQKDVARINEILSENYRLRNDLNAITKDYNIIKKTSVRYMLRKIYRKLHF